MRQMVGVDLFQYVGAVDWLCLTTNGDVTQQGKAVMGRGCALTAKQLWPHIDQALAQHLINQGNVPCPLTYFDFNGRPHQTTYGFTWVWSFPVKHHWQDKADLRLIVQSAKLLVYEADHAMQEPRYVMLPRPGCGNGGLAWEQVLLVLNDILDDRFIVVTNTAQ